MAIIYPMAISMSAESWVAIKRLEEVLVLDEKEESRIEKAAGKGVKVHKVTAAWLPDIPILKNLNFEVLQGKLCAVIGPVGAGKSSILQVFKIMLFKTKEVIMWVIESFCLENYLQPKVKSNLEVPCRIQLRNLGCLLLP